MLKIGLTGGIGCGKSTVSTLFSSFGIAIIDADDISRDLVQPQQPALEKIQQLFGQDIVAKDGALDRHKLRDIIFSDRQAKKSLEALLHPMIADAIQTKAASLEGAYCIISIPLLLEANMTNLVDRILVIDCPVAIQIERTKKRDNLATDKILAIINSQASRAAKLLQADDFIDNAQSAGKLAEQVKKLHNLYISISQ